MADPLTLPKDTRSVDRRVLITGSAGWLGSRLAWMLLDGGQQQVYGLVRPGTDVWRLKASAPAVQIVSADLDDARTLVDVLDEVRPDVCFHLAWPTEPGAYLNSPANIQALDASMRLAGALGKIGCHRFIGVGTCYEYETSLGPLTETSAVKPQTIYAAAKLASRFILEQIAASAGMSYLWARLFNLYGPMEDQRRLVPTVITNVLEGRRAAVTSGEQVRDYLHVHDAMAALALVGLGSLEGVINIGSGEPVTVATVATRLGEFLRSPQLIALGARQADPVTPAVVYSDPVRLRSTGWRPAFTLDAGLTDTIEWWKTRSRRDEA